VGKSKDTLDNVGDHSLGVKEVTSMFGHFIKYRVKAEQVQERVWQPVSMSAFGVLMTSQRQLQSVCHPTEISPRNKKDELYNDILKEIKARGLRWDSSEVHSGAAKRTIEVRIVYTRKESCTNNTVHVFVNSNMLITHLPYLV